MSNPDSSTPSIQALDLAVKPAGYPDWNSYVDAGFGPRDITYRIALAYAADLDKADKVGREGVELLDRDARINGTSRLADSAKALLQSLILPEPIDPLLAAWKADHQDAAVTREYMQGLEAAFDWITKRELQKEQDRG